MGVLLTADKAFDGRDWVEAPRILLDDDGVITSVESGGDTTGAGDRHRVIDLSGHTLLPGLIDAHVHTNLPGDGESFEQTMSHPDEQLAGASLTAAIRALEGGVTTIRDLGGRQATTYGARAAIERSGLTASAARMLLAGPSLTITGGHCRYFGGEADGTEGLRTAVRRRIGEGADVIKVIGSGGGTPNTISHLASFSAEEVTAIVDEAHRFGRRVTMHCLCADAMRNAIQAGVDGIEHGWFMTADPGVHEFDEQIAAQVADAGIAVCATMSVGAHILRRYETVDPTSDGFDDAYVEGWKENLAHTIEEVGRLHEAGVRLIGGTDAGWRFTPFDSMATEASLLTSAGLSVSEALGACTSTAADAIGVADVTGSLEPGRAGDIIAVAGDLATDIGLLASPAFVMRAGRTIRAPGQ